MRDDLHGREHGRRLGRGHETALRAADGATVERHQIEDHVVVVIRGFLRNHGVP
ncbi:hypothetical protein NKG05_30570 [Oerskovia sp. M15]